MLYISSRSKTDSFTAYRTLCSDYAPDGGVFIPYQIPQFSADELAQMRAKPFGQIVADILNLLFSAKLTSWDVDICTGKQSIRTKEIPHRMLLVENYHNPSGNYSYMEEHLFRKLAGKDAAEKPTCWAKIAFRIALLFGIYSVLFEQCRNPIDICVNAKDLIDPVAAWYAKKMGLPIRRIICSCTDNGALWDLTQRGEMNTSAVADECQIKQIEAILHYHFGNAAAEQLHRTFVKNSIFRTNEEELSVLSSELSAAVVGTERISELVRSVKKICNYDITDAAAVCYGGLQDYRAATGDICDTLILVDQRPA